MGEFESMTAEERIIRARIQLQKKHPFFSYVLMHMSAKETEQIDTMGVDKNGKMSFSRPFVMGLDEDVLMGSLCHEAYHVVFHHMRRVGSRDMGLWNIAADAVTNYMIVGEQMKLPEGTIIPKGTTLYIGDIEVDELDKKTAEHVYDELYKKAKKIKVQGCGGWDTHIVDKSGGSGSSDGDQKGKGKGGDGNGDGKDKKNGNGPQVEAVAGTPKNEREWKKVVSQALAHAKSRGDVPAGMERMVDDLLDAKLNWRHLLNRTITSMLPFDFTWRMPSKKSYASGWYLPSVIKENIEIVISVDVSGSVSQEELTEFISEIVHIGKSFQNLKATVIFFDAEIHNVYEVNSQELQNIMTYQIKGGGGTDHIPVFKWIKKNIPTCKLAVHFTDGDSDFPDEQPPFQNLWVLCRNSVPTDHIPYGDVIKIED